MTRYAVGLQIRARVVVEVEAESPNDAIEEAREFVSDRDLHASDLTDVRSYATDLVIEVES